MNPFNIKDNIDLNKGHKIYDLIAKLYPINRSITGNGVRKTLTEISKIVPLNVMEVPSGTKVLDWEIPLEWNIKDAWIKNGKGKKIVDFNHSNLHVLNYSIPIHKKTNLNELKKHLFSLPNHPEWIPYRTSYHSREWGFCMPHKQFLKLKEDDYEINIDSKLKEGSLSYGEYFIKGKSDEEVLISTHICHPSLANDNLSGLCISVFLAELLKKNETYYSYRFLFIPGTIGSIAWLSLNDDKIKNIKHGLVLTLLGDNGKFNYKKSRRGDTTIDKIVTHCLNSSGKDFGILEFSPYGYDERQYCSPGFDLAIGRFSRSVHGEFPEYHTSADNLDFIKVDKLDESFNMLLNIINIVENDNIFINQNPKGEPQLGKRGLFKKIGGQSDAKDFQMALLWVLNQSDGDNSLLDIAIKSKLNFTIIHKAATALKKVDLLKEPN